MLPGLAALGLAGGRAAPDGQAKGGAACHFVVAPASRQRLPELALVAGAILMYRAATQPALPTGFWEHAPQPTSGRLRRLLATGHWADVAGLPEQLRNKQSPTAH